MNAVTTSERNAVALSDAELLEVMEGSVYPGAKVASIKLALGYCKAAGLDPLQKPVHLVPMTVKTGEKNGFGDDITAKRDVVMPGIGLYRTQAQRTGVYAGQDRPVYGEMRALAYKKKIIEWVSQGEGKKNKPVNHFVDATIEYPEWCEITVYRLVGGQKVAFTSQEYWLENYATAGKDSKAPNEMWETRIRGQLKKCAEAQALRMAFPDAVGSQPTADEMEGRTHEATAYVDGDAVDAKPLTPQSKSAATAASNAQAEDVAFTETKAPAAAAQAAATPPATAASGSINSGQVKYLNQKFAAVGLEGDAILTFVKKHGAAALDEAITVAQFDAMKSELLAAL